jgi:hypothetical protein
LAISPSFSDSQRSIAFSNKDSFFNGAGLVIGRVEVGVLINLIEGLQGLGMGIGLAVRVVPKGIRLSFDFDSDITGVVTAFRTGPVFFSSA